MSWPSCDGRSIGEVAERSNATDCKSVALAASEVRILPSPPAFARHRGKGRTRRRAKAGRPATPTVESGLGGRRRGFAAGRSGGQWAQDAGLPAVAKAQRVREGGSNSVVESQPSKLLVAGSIPVSRSTILSPEMERDRET